MNKTENITFWDIWNEGKDGEVFEVTQWCWSSCVGDRIKVLKDEYFDRTVTRIVNEKAGQPLNISSSFMEATYKLVSPYRIISLGEAMDRLEKGLSVLAKLPNEAEYKYINKLSTLRGCDLTYISDLLELQFALLEDN